MPVYFSSPEQRSNRVGIDYMAEYLDTHTASRSVLCSSNCFSSVRFRMETGDENAERLQPWNSTLNALRIHPDISLFRSRPYRLSVVGACSHEGVPYGRHLVARNTSSNQTGTALLMLEVCRFENIRLNTISRPLPRTSNDTATFVFSYGEDGSPHSWSRMPHIQGEAVRWYARGVQAERRRMVTDV